MGHLWIEGAKIERYYSISRLPSCSARLPLSHARRTKTPNSARGFIKNCNFANCCLQGGREDELGNACPPLDRERLLAEIGEDDLDFAAIVGVDRAGRIEHRNPMPQGKSRAWPDLPFDPGRQCNRQARGDRRAAARRDDYGRIGRHCGDEIEAGREFALVCRKRQVAGMG